MDPTCGCTNIDDTAARRRITAGCACLLAAFVTVLLLKLRQPGGWLLLSPVPMFFSGYLCLMQAKTRTSIVLALLEQDGSQGCLEPVEDRETGRKLKRRSVKMLLASTALAVMSTLLCTHL